MKRQLNHYLRRSVTILMVAVLTLVAVFVIALVSKDDLFSRLDRIGKNWVQTQKLPNGWHADVTGQIEFLGLLRPRFEARNLVFWREENDISPDVGEWRIDINRVEVQLQLFPLLWGDVRIDRVLMQDGTLDVTLPDWEEDILGSHGFFDNAAQGGHGQDHDADVEVAPHSEVQTPDQTDNPLNQLISGKKWESARFQVSNLRVKIVEKGRTGNEEVRFWLEKLDSWNEKVRLNGSDDKVSQSTLVQRIGQAKFVPESQGDPINVEASLLWDHNEGLKNISAQIASPNSRLGVEGQVRKHDGEPVIQVGLDIEVAKPSSVQANATIARLSRLFRRSKNWNGPLSQVGIDVLSASQSWSLKMDIHSSASSISLPEIDFRAVLPDSGILEIDGRLEQIGQQHNVSLAFLLQADRSRQIIDRIRLLKNGLAKFDNSILRDSVNRSYWLDAPLRSTLTLNNLPSGGFSFDVKELSLGKDNVYGRLTLIPEDDNYALRGNLQAQEIRLSPLIMISSESGANESTDNEDANQGTIDKLTRRLSADALGLLTSDNQDTLPPRRPYLADIMIEIRSARLYALGDIYEDAHFLFEWEKGQRRHGQIQASSPLSGIAHIDWSQDISETPQGKQENFRDDEDEKQNPWNLNFTLDGVDAQYLLGALDVIGSLEGRVSATGWVSGTEDDNGAQIDVGKIRIRSIDGSLAFSLPTEKLGFPLKLVLSEVLSIDCFDGQIDLKKRLLVLESLRLMSFGQNWVIQGLIDPMRAYLDVGLFLHSGTKGTPVAWMYGKPNDPSVSLFSNQVRQRFDNDMTNYGVDLPDIGEISVCGTDEGPESVLQTIDDVVSYDEHPGS